MVDSSVQTPEVILVLCHSFFHDAFCLLRPVDAIKFKFWMSSRFVANFIIEKQAELPEGSPFAVTSKQAFDDFAVKFHGDKPSPRQKEMVEILHNSLTVIDAPSVSKLSLDDSVFVICDTLFSRSSYLPILVSDVPAKTEKAEVFYRRKDPKATIPYSIYNVAEADLFLHGKFTELAYLVDERMKDSLYQTKKLFPQAEKRGICTP